MTTSKIEWTDRSDWNPIRGCTRVSRGCGGPGDQGGCYAEAMAARFSQPGQWGHGFAEMKNGKPRWTGKVALAEDRLTLPLRWKKPAKVFVSSTSDVFHEALPDEAIDRIFAVMALCPQHTFQILTKRPERMRGHLSAARAHPVALEALDVVLHEVAKNPKSQAGAGLMIQGDIAHLKVWPLLNVWLGTSCEDQATADERIPHLLCTPAAIRFLSCEPLLGPIDLEHLPSISGIGRYLDAIGCTRDEHADAKGPVDWVICGGESGPNARPMHPDWARSLRDQCAEAGVPFFHKQNGEFAPGEIAGDFLNPEKAAKGKGWNGDVWFDAWSEPDGHVDDEPDVYRIGKKRAGRLLDGVEHNGFPP